MSRPTAAEMEGFKAEMDAIQARAKAITADVQAQIAEFRWIARRCWAQQDPKKPVTSLLRRMRARQATRFADELEAKLNGGDR